MNGPGPLSILIGGPIAGALLCLLVPARMRHAVALAASLALLGFAAVVAAQFDPSNAQLQFEERVAWIPALGAEYRVGLDASSVGFVLLTAVLIPLVLIGLDRTLGRDRAFLSLTLGLQGMLFGVFLAQNFLLWFLCYELTLIPAYLLIRLWGGPARAPAALQFFLTTQAGGMAMLIGFLALFSATNTLDLPTLASLGQAGKLGLASTLGFPHAGAVIFGLILLGLAVKIPLMPVHTWLPSAYAEAPAPVTMLLTGLLSKLGLYGLFRLLIPLFPAELAAFRGPLVALATLTVISSALAALAQSDLKRIFAYSSISHLGLCALALFATAGRAVPGGSDPGTTGALLLALNHGITAPALFWFAGILEARSGGQRELTAFGGLRAQMPVLAGMMGLAIFASLGLPGLNGFPGELLIFRGLLPASPVAGAIALCGLLVTAVFLIRMMHGVFHGPLRSGHTNWADLTGRERLIGSLFVLAMVALGLWPRFLTDLFAQMPGGLLP